MNISLELMFITSRQFLPYSKGVIKFSIIYNISHGQQNGTPGRYFPIAKGQNNKLKPCRAMKVFTVGRDTNFRYSFNVLTVRRIEKFSR